jgi:hypothetical protein
MNPEKHEVSNVALKSILIASNQDDINKILQGNYSECFWIALFIFLFFK